MPPVLTLEEFHATGDKVPVYGDLPFPHELGDSENFSMKIGELELNSEDPIELPPVGVTAIVGANNVGKSTLLREISGFSLNPVGSGIPPNRLVRSLTFSRKGTAADFNAWLLDHYAYVQTGGNQPGFHSPTNQFHPMANLQIYFANLGDQPSTLGMLSQFLLSEQGAFDRMSHTNPTEGRQSLEAHPVQPLQHLEADRTLMSRLSGYFERVFGQVLYLDTLTGRVCLRLGSPDAPTPLVDAVDPDYLKAVAKLPTLESQGDGVRSFVGILLPILTRSSQILLIDEPEAFLHPPQAVALGEILAELALEREMQVIVATHDRNFLAGLLQSEQAAVSVVRLDRVESSPTRAYQLDASRLRELWSDPILRYSNMLDGLFHRFVVLAENDRDCRFYSAALDYARSEERVPFPGSDVLFIPSAGKSSLRRFATALRAAEVRVLVSPDLDILRVENDVRSLAESLGGNWQDLKVDYLEAKKVFQQSTVRTCGEVLGPIVNTLEPRASKRYTPEIHKEVVAAISLEDLSAQLKRTGVEAFGRGEARRAAISLLDALEKIGIVPVRFGELENFAPELTAGKAEWVDAAFKIDAHKNERTQEHIDRIVAAYAGLK